MHRSFRLVGSLLFAASLAACASNSVSTPSTGAGTASVAQRPPQDALIASRNALTPDGTPVHALLPRVGAAAPAPHASSLPQYDLVYHSGPIQKSPKIFLVFWGFNTSANDPDGVAPYLTSFVRGLSGDSYFNIVTQYYSTAQGNILDPSGEYVAAYYDSAAPPHNPSDSAIANEAIKAAGVLGYKAEASYVVQLPHGAYGKNLSYCAYHSVHSSTYGPIHYTDLPYQPDYPGCGENSVNPGSAGVNDATSESAAHEIAETQTDPDTRTGWFDKSGNEIGDYCAYINLQNYTFSTGTFAIQPLWSNAANYCAVTYP